MSPRGGHVRSFIDEFLEGHETHQEGIFISSSDSFQRKIWGRKRHVLVDTQGHLLAVKVLAADPSDQEGAKRLLEPVAHQFPSIEVLWGDSHYGGDLIAWVKEHLGWTVQTVKRPKVPKRGLLVPIGEEIDWDRLFPSGFTVLPKRWVIERTFAWITRVRRLARDHEGLPRSSEAFITLAMSRLMLTQLAPQVLEPIAFKHILREIGGNVSLTLNQHEE